MPRERRVNRFSTNCPRPSPYACYSNDPKHVEFDRELGSLEDVQQWREARCPFCLDHPHNAVLLICSNFENGCRPYVCNTGVRHSNCFEQFCKLPASSPEILSASGGDGRILEQLDRVHESEELPKLHCPLCRGEIRGWRVVEAARKFMNSESRNCSCETCDFVGNFAELRRHTRSEHPFVWPSEVDPERKKNWAQMEYQRHVGDLISMSYDHSQNNLENQEDFEDQFIDAIVELLPSMNEEERVYFLFAAYVYSYFMGSSALRDTFTITVNTANGEANRIQNNGVRLFTEILQWLRERGRASVGRLLGITIRLRGHAAVSWPPGTNTCVDDSLSNDNSY